MLKLKLGGRAAGSALIRERRSRCRLIDEPKCRAIAVGTNRSGFREDEDPAECVAIPPLGRSLVLPFEYWSCAISAPSPTGCAL